MISDLKTLVNRAEKKAFDEYMAEASKNLPRDLYADTLTQMTAEHRIRMAELRPAAA